LATIDRLFPESQYIHIIRDPRAVVASILAKGWLDFEDAIQAWRGFVTHARDFGGGLDVARYHEVRFERLVKDGHATVHSIFDFLDLPSSPDVNDYLSIQMQGRVPLSYPTGQPGSIGRAAWEGRLDRAKVGRIEYELSDLMGDLDYEKEVGSRNPD
jgi:hypothetical protein